jgi:hypothetical protein
MKFLIGCLVFVAVFSFAKGIASPSDLDAAMASTNVAQATAIKNAQIDALVK